MPRPGVTVSVVDEIVQAGPALNTGTGFMVGVTERGPAGTPTRVSSFRQYKDTFGSLAGGSEMYKAAYSFFNEGGLFLYVIRATGTGAVAATGVATGWINITAKSPGVWGNGVSVLFDYTAGAPATYVVKVSLSGVLQEQSIPLQAAQVKDFQSALVAFTEVGSPTPPTADTTVNLTTGANGAAPTVAELVANINAIAYSYGPGQVAVPGNVDPLLYPGLAAHCEANHRVALVDLPDVPDKASLLAAVQALDNEKGSRQILALGQRINYPAETAPAVWDVPYTGVQMGMVSRVDGLSDPSLAAAGSLGISRLALAPKRDFTDADREELNGAGVTLARMVNGQVRTYGYRTAAGPAETNWLFWQESRVVMGIAHECGAVLEEFVFKTIDGRGKIFIRVNVALAGVCQRYYAANALFGETPAEAFAVDTSYPGLNTVESVAAGTLRAQVRVKTSRIAEWITLDIVKVPLTRQV